MNTEYRTTDIVLAAFLKISGCIISRIEKVGQRGTFVFASVSHQLVDQYDLGQSSVEPIAFNNAIKHLTTSVRRMD